MSFESQMENGYPAVADIESFLSDRGLEVLTENNPEFIDEFTQFFWGLVNAIDWSSALGVYLPSATTFNVRGGHYNYKGDIKEYTPGEDVNPTDNDTTYIWLEPDNSIDSGIDGDGWPTTEHIKLAEIDVDAEGVITEIRDLRGKQFLQFSEPLQMLASISAVNLNSVAATNLYTVPTGKKLLVDHVVIRGLSATAGSAVVTFGKSTAKTDFVAARTLSNLSAAGKAAKIEPVPATTPAAIVEYAAAEIFVIDVTTAAGSACTAVVEVWGHLIDA